jgi:hypothetical protein
LQSWRTELKYPLAPKLVQKWAINAPAWVEVHIPNNSLTLAQLELEEIEAVTLAAEVHDAPRMTRQTAGANFAEG